MRINLTKEIEKDSLISHIVLKGLIRVFKGKKFEKYIESYKTKKGLIVNVKMLVNDIEIPLQSFINLWQKQVDKFIKEEAKDILELKCSDGYNLMCSMVDKLKTQIEKEDNKLYG